MIAGERQRAVGGLQSLGLEIILHDHRHAMQRPGKSGLRETPVQLLGLFLHVRIQHHDGIDRRPVLVVGLDALQIIAHQFPASKSPRLHGVVDLRDRCLDDVEGRRRQRRLRRTPSLPVQQGGGGKKTAERANHQIIV